MVREQNQMTRLRFEQEVGLVFMLILPNKLYLVLFSFTVNSKFIVVGSEPDPK